MIRKKLISISGLDGAGKTSTINELINIAASSNIPIKYVWGSYELILLKPIVRLGQFLFLRKSNQFRDYTGYYNCIKRLSKKSILSKTYEILTLLEYTIQVIFKITIPYMIGKKIIICDRYYYDVFVSLAVTLSYTKSELKKKLKIFSWFYPKPDYAFLLDIPEEISFNRKNDIPSIEYLKQRRNLYIEIAKEYGMKILDGTKDVKTNAEIIFNNVIKEEGKK